ncbi:MAG: hypothetical protein ACLPWS_20645 [Rhodomicrobium sp.]
MTGTSGDFLQAVYGLRKAAEAEFSGNEYYRVANEIAGLAELAGWDKDAPAGKGAAYGFASMLAEVRKLAAAGVPANRHSLVAHKLDVLQAILTPPAKEIRERMTETSGDLLQAVYGLRKAAEAEFSGNEYYRVANEIAGLAELAGWDKGEPAGKGAAYGFASMLAEVRKLAATSVPANRYSLVAHKLDVLQAILTPPAKETGKAGAMSEKREAAIAANAAAGTSAAPKPGFSELAALSAARVQEMAESLGIAPAHRIPHAAAEAPAGLGMERRSSEPCAMAELAPVTMEPLAPAAIPAGQKVAEETPAERRLERRSSEPVKEILEAMEPAPILAEGPPEPDPAEAAFYLGSPAPQSDAGLEEEEVRADIAAAEAAAEPAALVSAAVPDNAAPPAGQKIEVKKPDQTKAKPPKTLFKLWLDLAFGRKD